MGAFLSVDDCEQSEDDHNKGEEEWDENQDAFEAKEKRCKRVQTPHAKKEPKRSRTVCNSGDFPRIDSVEDDRLWDCSPYGKYGLPCHIENWGDGLVVARRRNGDSCYAIKRVYPFGDKKFDCLGLYQVEESHVIFVSSTVIRYRVQKDDAENIVIYEKSPDVAYRVSCNKIEPACITRMKQVWGEKFLQHSTETYQMKSYNADSIRSTQERCH